MGYQTPTENTATSVANVSVTDTSVESEYPARISLTTGQFGSGDVSVEVTEDLFQKILDAIESHPDLTVSSATRAYRVDQTITPA